MFIKWFQDHNEKVYQHQALKDLQRILKHTQRLSNVVIQPFAVETKEVTEVQSKLKELLNQLNDLKRDTISIKQSDIFIIDGQQVLDDTSFQDALAKLDLYLNHNQRLVNLINHLSFVEDSTKYHHVYNDVDDSFDFTLTFKSDDGDVMEIMPETVKDLFSDTHIAENLRPIVKDIDKQYSIIYRYLSKLKRQIYNDYQSLTMSTTNPQKLSNDDAFIDYYRHLAEN